MKSVLSAVLFGSLAMAQVVATVNAGGGFTLTYNGRSWRTTPDTLGYPYANLTLSGGSSTAVYRISSSGSGSAITFVFANFTTVTTLTGGEDTLTVTTDITNTSGTEIVGLRYNQFTINFPSVATSPATSSTSVYLQGNMGSPVGYFYGSSWSLGMWNNYVGEDLSITTSSTGPGQTSIGMAILLPELTTPGVKTASIMPGETVRAEYTLKFSDVSAAGDTKINASGYSRYRDVYPYRAVNHPDRRPWAEWYTADKANSTLSNPRGYWQNSSLVASDPVAFASAMQAKLNSLLTTLSGLAIKPQGIMIWDIEGQEFNHAMTYIGDPSLMPIISPEMNATADSIISQIKTAGYSVGFTLRPMAVKTGTILPATCSASPKDVFIKTDAVYPDRGYRCDFTDTWTQVQLYDQTALTSVSQVLSNMRTKIDFAVNRWGAVAFYVDSTVDMGGNFMSTEVWTTLQLEYPNVIFFPENDSFTTVQSAGLFNQARFGLYGPTATQRYLYDKAFGFVNVQDWDGITGYSSMVSGVAQGDTLAFNGWYGNQSQTDAANLYTAAATLNATVAMTDRGQQRTFKSSPGTSFTYPVTARVYFADTANNLAESTTYCTRRATDSCYLNGVLQSTATLDLSALTYYQLRYYDFAGGLVSNPGFHGRIQ